jgi:signal peptidase I
MQNDEPGIKEPTKKKKKTFNVREILIMVLIFLVVFATVQFSMQSFRIDGPSMFPSFEQSEFIMVNKLSYHFGDPQRGDVIIFDPPFSSNYPFIKRVIGLPGELVEIEQGKIYIDGHLLEETPDMGSPGRDISVLVKEDNYFVLGDNRDNSRDSTEGWTVPRENIIGKSWMIYWPLSRWGLSPKYHYDLVATA